MTKEHPVILGQGNAFTFHETTGRQRGAHQIKSKYIWNGMTMWNSKTVQPCSEFLQFKATADHLHISEFPPKVTKPMSTQSSYWNTGKHQKFHWKYGVSQKFSNCISGHSSIPETELLCHFHAKCLFSLSPPCSQLKHFQKSLPDCLFSISFPHCF